MVIVEASFAGNQNLGNINKNGATFAPAVRAPFLFILPKFVTPHNLALQSSMQREVVVYAGKNS